MPAEAIASTSRQTAAIASTGVLAWAYLIALSRGDAGVAKGLLRAFQETYNTYRYDIVSDLVGDTSMVPQSVPENGTWGDTTRRALVVALGMGMGIPFSDAAQLPSSAAGAGTWFSGLQAGSIPTPNTRQAEALAGTRDPDEAYGEALDWVLFNVEGISPPTDVELQTATAPVPASPLTLSASLLTAPRTAPQAQWPLYLFMAALGVGAAGVGWVLYNKKFRRRRRS